MLETTEAARMNGRPLGIGQLGGYHHPTSKALPAQATADSSAELASRAYQQAALSLPGALGLQAAALAAFYCGVARQQMGAAR
jgi:hypothetical protein